MHNLSCVILIIDLTTNKLPSFTDAFTIISLLILLRALHILLLLEGIWTSVMCTKFGPLKLVKPQLQTSLYSIMKGKVPSRAWARITRWIEWWRLKRCRKCLAPLPERPMATPGWCICKKCKRMETPYIKYEYSLRTVMVRIFVITFY